MTPQSSILVLAPVTDGQEATLRALLASMNQRPGMADPRNALVPFGQFVRLHFARFVVVEARTGEDIAVYNIPPLPWPASLALVCDVDGPADTFLAELAERAEPGLRRIFACCEGFSDNTDVLTWMRQHQRSASANYVNWIGRTVVQVHEEQALRAALSEYLRSDAAPACGEEAPAIVRDRLLGFVETERRAGRLRLSAPEPTPVDWRVRNLLHLLGVPAALLLLAPFLLLASPLLVFLLRSREKTDPVIAPEPAASHVRRTAVLEDHDVTNQFTVFGDVKPGRFRRWTLTFLLWLLDYSVRHIFNRGHLTRVSTIHFARWVFLDDKKRLFFASNYDGSLNAYMDDFINKVAWGINLVFSNGVGYPRTAWLIKRGARNEQVYERVLRRHQLPTDVWYKAYPGLTAVDLERNSRIRAGVERRDMTDREVRTWLRLL